MVNSSVNGKSYVYGIIGNPISHSFSPTLQNTVAGILGINSIYVPFKVESGMVSQAVNGAFALGIKGMNVTVPHKKEVMPCLSDLDGLAEKIGAVNTLKLTENGYKGYNTDILGLFKCFETAGVSIRGKTAAVIGAGGAANAAVTLAAEKGAKKIYIANRTVENAEKLKDTVRKYYGADIEAIPLGHIEKAGRPDIIIQATSVGMGDGRPVSPVENDIIFENAEFAVDIIYTPWETKFLLDARKKGVKCVNGFDMLVYQGLASFEIWNEISIPVEKALEIRRILVSHYIEKGGRP